VTLPQGFSVRLGHGLLTAPGDDVLIGGSPLTAIRLSARAKTYVSGGTVTVSDQSSATLARRLLATNLAHPDFTNVPALQTDQLTVVVPVRDRPDQLAHTLEALHPLRCIVVDDASRDPNAVSDVCARYRAEYSALKRNVGPAGARNVGLSCVRTPFVAFVDSDVTVTCGSLLLLSRHFADPAVALAGPVSSVGHGRPAHAGSSGTTPWRPPSPSADSQATSGRARSSHGYPAPASSPE